MTHKQWEYRLGNAQLPKQRISKQSLIIFESVYLAFLIIAHEKKWKG